MTAAGPASTSRVPEFRFHNFFDATTDVNFNNGDIADWIWTADPIFGHAGTQFYAPVISDPTVSGTMFAGTGRTVYRTKTFGLGNRTLAEAQRDLQRVDRHLRRHAAATGRELGPTPLTDAVWGDRAGGAVAAIERTTGRHVDRLGGDHHRPGVHHQERRRRAGQPR